MTAVSLKNVSYQYPLENHQVIRNVSFEIEKGQVWGLIGANESGKTSICNIIRGFISQLYRGVLEGEVTVNGKPVAEYGDGELASIVGYSFQNPFTQISGVKETVYEELAYGFELSGGQKQRVALASMIALDPEIIIMDEPTSQLDPKSTEDIFEIIRLLKKQGKTIILVEHKIDLVAEYCDHILLLDDGQAVMQGKTEDILTNPDVLKYGGQLPQVVLYFLDRMQRTGSKETIPLTVSRAYEILKGGRQ